MRERPPVVIASFPFHGPQALEVEFEHPEGLVGVEEEAGGAGYLPVEAVNLSFLRSFMLFYSETNLFRDAQMNEPIVRIELGER